MVAAGGTCVVAGIDFSDGALSAVREGRWLAERVGLGLQVLHVVGDGVAWQPDRHTWDWLRTASVHPNTLLVRRGLAWVELVRHAREVSAAVVVLGSFGSSGAQAVNLGSTASRVALRAPCPVLFVGGWRESSPPLESPHTTIHLSEGPA